MLPLGENSLPQMRQIVGAAWHAGDAIEEVLVVVGLVIVVL